RTSAPPVVVGGAGARPPPVSPGRLPPCVEDGPSGRRVLSEPGLVFELLDQEFTDITRPALPDPQPDRGRVQVDHAGEPGLAKIDAPVMVRLSALALRVCPVEPVDTLAEGHAVAPSCTISAAFRSSSFRRSRHALLTPISTPRSYSSHTPSGSRLLLKSRARNSNGE